MMFSLQVRKQSRPDSFFVQSNVEIDIIRGGLQGKLVISQAEFGRLARTLLDSQEKLLEIIQKDELTNRGQLTPAGERKLQTLILAAAEICAVGIEMANSGRPELTATAKLLKSRADDVLKKGLEFLPEPRFYVGSGLFVFSEKNQVEALRPFFGLMRHSKDLDESAELDLNNNSIPDGVEHIVGCQYGVKDQVVPYANDVLAGRTVEGRYYGTPEDRNFVQELIGRKILVRNGNTVQAGQFASLAATHGGESTFSHEIAHAVSTFRPELIEKAKGSFSRLPERYRRLFHEFMKTMNENYTEENKFFEYFAYTNQSGDDWIDHARGNVGYRAFDKLSQMDRELFFDYVKLKKLGANPQALNQAELSVLADFIIDNVDWRAAARKALRVR